MNLILVPNLRYQNDTNPVKDWRNPNQFSLQDRI